MRWHYRDRPLVWLLVAAYAMHVCEEWFGGFPAWVARIVGRPLSGTGFILINSVAMVVMIAGAGAAIKREEYGWIATAIATVLFVNAFLHLLGSLATASYSPGLVTGVILYLPLGQLLLLRAWHQTTAPRFWRGVLAGLAAHALVGIAALSVLE